MFFYYSKYNIFGAHSIPLMGQVNLILLNMEAVNEFGGLV